MFDFLFQKRLYKEFKKKQKIRFKKFICYHILNFPRYTLFFLFPVVQNALNYAIIAGVSPSLSTNRLRTRRGKFKFNANLIKFGNFLPSCVDVLICDPEAGHLLRRFRRCSNASNFAYRSCKSWTARHHRGQTPTTMTTTTTTWITGNLNTKRQSPFGFSGWCPRGGNTNEPKVVNDF